MLSPILFLTRMIRAKPIRPTRMNTSTETSPNDLQSRKKPRLAYAIATVLGVGYLKPGPGTWGSLVGIVVAILFSPFCLLFLTSVFMILWHAVMGRLHDFISAEAVSGRLLTIPSLVVFLVIALFGVWSSSRVASFANVKDPQFVVIDEVSGQHLTLLLGLVPFWLPASVSHNPDFVGYGFLFMQALMNWRYLLAAFILFRLFDIWKPFPIRRLENLPGGWGIMADDWLAAVYAAILLRLALHFNLL
jgi:phosphatidylglycerophosphatase A